MGKPSVAAIRPRTPYGQKTAAFCPFLRSFLSPLSACLPIGQEQVVNLTLQDIMLLAPAMLSLKDAEIEKIKKRLDALEGK